MQSATVVCRYINPPKSPKGPGSIKDETGRYWKCWPKELSFFKEGNSYQLGFETEIYQGKESYIVRAVAEAPAFRSDNGSGVPLPPAPIPMQQPPVHYAAGVPAHSSPQPSTSKDINISVLALAKPYIELGSVPIEELETMLVKIKHIVTRVL